MSARVQAYLMEDPREAGRLESKVDARRWVERYLADHVTAGSTVLDVGCGPGHLTRAVTQRWPGIRAIGVDLSEDRLAEARRKGAGYGLLEFRLGTALALPCPEASVDLVFCRFLLEYLPDPLSAVQEMRRVLRPGGLILLQDLDGQLLRNFPPDPVLARAIERTLRSMAAAGFDPHVGRKLFHFAFLAGFSPVSTAVEPYHVIAGRATDAQLREWTTKLDIALPLLRRALGSAESAVRVRDRFLGYLARADTFSYSNVITVVARAPSPPHSP